MQKEKKAIALNPNGLIHFTDHLAPLCIAMGIPLLLTEEIYAQEAQYFYPGLDVLIVDCQDFSYSFLIENFDVLFIAEPWHRHQFYAQFQSLEKLYDKTIRCVHCPHGFSDKISWFEKCVWEDILLFYGDNMLHIFKESELSSHINIAIRMGNLRYLYYQQHQAFYHQITEKYVWQYLDASRPTILYAPTHRDQEHSTSLVEAYPLLDGLSDDYNLIVKVHPVFSMHEAPMLELIMSKYASKKNIFFLKDFSLVYPILARSDIYLGDMSSIGYDFLTFNRPMFFLNHLKRKSEDRNLFLYRCGREIKPEQYKDFYSILHAELPFDKERYEQIRQETYVYTFGKEVPFHHLKNNIEAAYNSPKKWD
jgi:hypothetical protein